MVSCANVPLCIDYQICSFMLRLWHISIQRFPKVWVPLQLDGLQGQSQTNMDDLRIPLFQETSIFTHMNGYCLLSSIHGWLFHSKASSYWGTPIYGNYTHIYIYRYTYIYIYIHTYIYVYISHKQSRLIPICTDRITRSLLTATSLPEARTEVWGNMGHAWTNEKYDWVIIMG